MWVACAGSSWRSSLYPRLHFQGSSNASTSATCVPLIRFIMLIDRTPSQTSELATLPDLWLLASSITRERLHQAARRVVLHKKLPHIRWCSVDLPEHRNPERQDWRWSVQVRPTAGLHHTRNFTRWTKACDSTGQSIALASDQSTAKWVADLAAATSLLPATESQHMLFAQRERESS